MCGILLVASVLEVACGTESHSGPEATSPAAADFAEGLARRGPDYQGCHTVSCGPAQLLFHGSLLQLRGEAPSRSPLSDAAGNVLLFNGQVFGGSLPVPPGCSDAQLLLAALAAPGAEVPAVLTGLQGPWALVFWQAATRTLWFGRDAIGRRSLLMHLPSPEDGRFILSSSAPLDPSVPFSGWSELPPGLHSLALQPPTAAAAATGVDGSGSAASHPGSLASDDAKLGASYAQHEWTEEVVQRLAAFWRAPELLEAPPGAPETKPPAAQAAAHGSSRAEATAAVPVAAGQASGPGTAAALAAATEAAPGAGPGAEAAAVGVSAAGAACEAEDSGFEATVDRVMAALRHAVAVRCRCIHERAQQPEQQSTQQPEQQSVQQPEQQSTQQLAQQQLGQEQLEQQLDISRQGNLSACKAGQQGACACLASAGATQGQEQQQAQQAQQEQQQQQQAQQEQQQQQQQQQREHQGEQQHQQQEKSQRPHPCQLQCQQPAPLLLPPAPVLVLFSGGVDSTLLAALAHEALPSGVPIDLACVCFDGGASPDRQSALDALAELRQLAPGREWRLIQVDCTLADVEASRPRLLRLLAPTDTVMDLNIGAALWLAARGAGSVLQRQRGELPIEGAAGQAGQAEGQQAAGQAGQAERQNAERQQTAAQAEGQICGEQAKQAEQAGGQRQPQQPQRTGASLCRSAARVALLGHGADELCGGYGRHRTAFRVGGWAGLGAELELDLKRLWLRNLGRDDRLVADHGREARHPFLDEGVVSAVLAAPLHHLADLRLPPGIGDKRVLRACLHRLGLHRAAGRAKRAIQFGSRLAAKTNTAAFGSVRRANRKNAGSVRLADVPGMAASVAGPADGMP